MRRDNDRPEESAADAAVPLDMLLTSAARGQWQRFVPGRAGLRFIRALARKPQAVAGRSEELARELAAIAIGRSHLAPDTKDRRFADPAWMSNWALRAILQCYLAVGHAVTDVADQAELDWRDAEKMRFIIDNLINALAPSNNPVLNPLTWKAMIDTGGASAAHGVLNLVRDLARKPRVPTMVDVSGFRLGNNIAATDGAVVLRTPVFELIQYKPTTEEIGTIPLLIVPPLINKFYVVDLAPGRSLIEYLVSRGQHVFAVSWRNPGMEQRDWGLDTYGQAVIDALIAIENVTNSRRVHTLSLCSSGALTSMVAAHLTDTRDEDRIASCNLAVSVLDQSNAGLTSALADHRAAKIATAASAAKGYLEGSALAEMFAWMRPNDLIWSYWVNNYLQGRKPAAFDVLFWNADTTRMAAALHRDFVELFLANQLGHPGSATMLGTPIDLTTVKADSYIVAGIADHISRWQSCYRSVALLGGDTRFVLSTSGHVACIVNPPTNPKATFRTNEARPEDPQEWIASAHATKGSWWPDFADWLAERNGGTVRAPSTLGSSAHTPTDKGPGTYVFEK